MTFKEMCECHQKLDGKKISLALQTYGHQVYFLGIFFIIHIIMSCSIISRDKVRESNIVNKTFIVEFVPGDSLYDSDEENLSHRSGRKSSSSLKVRCYTS